MLMLRVATGAYVLTYLLINWRWFYDAPLNQFSLIKMQLRSLWDQIKEHHMGKTVAILALLILLSGYRIDALKEKAFNIAEVVTEGSNPANSDTAQHQSGRKGEHQTSVYLFMNLIDGLGAEVIHWGDLTSDTIISLANWRVDNPFSGKKILSADPPDKMEKAMAESIKNDPFLPLWFPESQRTKLENDLLEGDSSMLLWGGFKNIGKVTHESNPVSVERSNSGITNSHSPPALSRQAETDGLRRLAEQSPSSEASPSKRKKQ